MHGGKQIFSSEWISLLAWKQLLPLELRWSSRGQKSRQFTPCSVTFPKLGTVSQRLLVGAPQELCVSPGTSHFPKPRLRCKPHELDLSLLGTSAISMEEKSWDWKTNWYVCMLKMLMFQKWDNGDLVETKWKLAIIPVSCLTARYIWEETQPST